MSLSIPAADFDISLSLPSDPGAASPQAQVWLLLCALTLTEVDPNIDGLKATEIANALLASEEYRALDADAAAYLWLSRASNPDTADELSA